MGRVKKALHEMGYEVHGMQGAYYSFFKAPGDIADVDFVEKLADHNLILVPGRAFSRLQGFVRLSYGAEIQEVQKGLAILAKVTKEIRG